MGLIGIDVELLGYLFTVVVGFLLYIVVVKMRVEMKGFTWSSYFKTCNVYQGRCWWHDLKDFILK